MKTLVLLIALLAVPCTTVLAQDQEVPEGTTIASAQVSGINEDRLSPGLRRDINALAGTPLTRTRLQELATRIEQERPGVAAAVRALPADGGGARVVFFVAQVDAPPEQNVNERYTIESAAITGIEEDNVSQQLRDDLQALVGTRVSYDEADKIGDRLRKELPGYDVDRRMVRGSQRGQLRLEFDVRKGEDLRWLHFASPKSKFLYHTEQGWGGIVDIPIGGRDWRVSPILAIDNRDDLVEEYWGLGVRVESRHVGTERLGASLELTWFEQTWLGETLNALALNPQIPGAYDTRTSVTPMLTFALTQHLRVGGGVSINELEPLADVLPSQMANAAVMLVGYDQRWRRSNFSQHLDATFEVRTGTDALESDLEYTRSFGRADYVLEHGRNVLLVSGLAGRISSDLNQAPLFERFTLGDSSTLRGWNKYDIAPIGGDRVFHTSIEFRHRGFALFMDTGSVWNGGQNSDIRTSTGFGFHQDAFFATLGFPLNTDDLDVMFMIGVRF